MSLCKERRSPCQGKKEPLPRKEGVPAKERRSPCRGKKEPLAKERRSL